MTEPQIEQALQATCRQEFYIELTPGATVAGVRQYLARVPADVMIVPVFANHGREMSRKIATRP